jgi:hypothetical protein
MSSLYTCFYEVVYPLEYVSLIYLYILLSLMFLLVILGGELSPTNGGESYPMVVENSPPRMCLLSGGQLSPKSIHDVCIL